MAAKDLFTFPNPVDEVSARVVAAGVLALSSATVATRRRWLFFPLAYGFIARALTGPTLSPLGQLATRVIRPRLHVEERPTAGPPKRFAQTLGAIVTLTALTLAYPLKRPQAAYTLAGVMMLFASLESGFNVCIGCKLFGVLMKVGMVPEAICAECANLWSRPNMRAHAPSVVERGPEHETR